MVPAIKTGETRERQALPANLSLVESSRWRRCSGRGAVRPLGSSSGLRLPVIVIMASSMAGRNQPRRVRDIYCGDAAAVASPRPCACARACSCPWGLGGGLSGIRLTVVVKGERIAAQ